MCGIIGLFNIHNEQAMRTEALKMVRKIRHRGPDWSGSYNDDYCVIMHERLSIVDVEHGAQPLYDSIKKRVLAVNGEIYNHLELRKKYLSDCIFKTNSDTETLLLLYLKYNDRMFDFIDGMYAFAILDKNTNRIILGRDRSGKKPLYIYQNKNVIFFASELNALKIGLNNLQLKKGLQL